MYRGKIPEFGILAAKDLKLSSLANFEQLLEKELTCFSALFKQLPKFEFDGVKTFSEITVDENLQYCYLYKFQPKQKDSYYKLYLKLASTYTQLDAEKAIEFAKTWSNRRYQILSTYKGYYEYRKTSASFESALYVVEQMLRRNRQINTLIKDFQQQTQKARNLVFNNLQYIDFVTENYIENCGNDPLLLGLAQNGILQDLERNAWRKIRRYQGDDRFHCFIKVVVQNKIKDMRATLNGKHCRIPDWIKKQEVIYTKAYEFLLCDKWEKHDAVPMLIMAYPDKNDTFIWEMVNEILVKHPPSVIPIEMVMNDDDLPTSDDSQAGNADELALKTVLGLVFDETIDTRQLPTDFKCKNLTDEDRLILKMRFETGLTLKQIARALKTPESSVLKQLIGILKIRKTSRKNVDKSTIGRRLKTILNNLKDCLQKFLNDS
jgi:DNA-directed RNA polymerase specialized sigma24 family protein